MSETSYRVYMVDPYVNSINSMASRLFIDNPSLISNMVWDPEDPDYVFVSECIYGYKDNYLDYLRLVKKNRGKEDPAIFIMADFECLMPDLNMFDYAICFDDRSMSDRVTRIPLIIFFGKSIFNLSNSLSLEDAHREYNSRRFCNFMYSNGDGHPMRERLYHKISEYKPIEATGSFLHNTDISADDSNENWHLESINVKSHYRFSIASENATYPGYTTEKLLSSLQAHTVPIYWGNPNVASEFNASAFINVHDYASLDDMLEDIKSIDMDEDRWCEIVCQPFITEPQLCKAIEDMKNYKAFIEGIFAQNKKDAHRRPLGFWPTVYENWLFWR